MKAFQRLPNYLEITTMTIPRRPHKQLSKKMTSRDSLSAGHTFVKRLALPYGSYISTFFKMKLLVSLLKN